MATSGELPELIVSNAAAWGAWLTAHHGASPGVGLVLARKGVTEPTTLTFDEALDEALSHGWIDGRRNSRDSSTYTQRFTPRRPRSTWSKRNIGIVDRLVAEGRMYPEGIREVQRAQEDGRWAAAYDGPATIAVPPDLADALAAEPRAAAMFEILTSQNRFAVLFRIGGAKRADTRARRIERFVSMLARGETVYPQKRSLED